jgi:DNA-directed RNA polymerase subunit RPC12/RpoP
MTKKLYVWCTDCGKSFFCNDMIAKRIAKGKKTDIYCPNCGSCENTVHYKYNFHLNGVQTHKKAHINNSLTITKLKYGKTIRRSKHWVEI